MFYGFFSRPVLLGYDLGILLWFLLFYLHTDLKRNLCLIYFRGFMDCMPSIYK